MKINNKMIFLLISGLLLQSIWLYLLDTKIDGLLEIFIR